MATEASDSHDVLMNLDGPRDPAAAREAYEQACKAEDGLDREKAVDLFRQAVEHDPSLTDAMFRLAYHMDMLGEDDEALHLYETCASDAPPTINTLINMAVLYEDMGRYGDAEKCLRQVIDTKPNHLRARLFLKDVQDSRGMYIDETKAKSSESDELMIETPISDFELSVRARNCLRKMNIRTIGDLLRTTESELMAYKNFGETSLVEIKAMLHKRNLSLGQMVQNQQSAAREEIYEQLRSSGNEHLLDMPVAELDLSVRARKALALLNIGTIGDLVGRTEAELLGIKNFGQTSLDEIKERLTERGLSLRTLSE